MNRKEKTLVVTSQLLLRLSQLNLLLIIVQLCLVALDFQEFKGKLYLSFLLLLVLYTLSKHFLEVETKKREVDARRDRLKNNNYSTGMMGQLQKAFDEQQEHNNL